MVDRKSVESMVLDIQNMRRIAEHLRDTGSEIVTIECNITRILSSIRLLEMNVSDLAAVST